MRERVSKLFKKIGLWLGKTYSFARKFYILEAIFSVILLFVFFSFVSGFSSANKYNNFKDDSITDTRFTYRTSYTMSFEAQEDTLGYLRINIDPSKSVLKSSDKLHVSLTDDTGSVLATSDAYLYNASRNYIKVDFGNTNLSEGQWYYLNFSFDNMAPSSVLIVNSHHMSSFRDALDYSSDEEDPLSMDLAIGFSRVINISYYYVSSDSFKAFVHFVLILAMIIPIWIRKIHQKKYFKEIYRALCASSLIYLIGEVLNIMNKSPLNILFPLTIKHVFCVVLAVVIFLSIYYFLYSLIGKGSISMAIAVILFGIVAFVNHTKLVMRGDSFVPWDILSAGIAVKTGSTYYFHVTLNFIAGIALCVAILCVLIITDTPYRKLNKFRGLLIPFSFIILLFIFSSFVLNPSLLNKLNIYYDVNPPLQSFNENGVYTAFALHLNNIEASGSTDNSPELTQELIYMYSGMANDYNLDSRVNDSSVKPNVICIMSESFTDLRDVREFDTSEDISPYYDTLIGDTIHGKAAVSIFGGGTCNSEFEFLTGNSMNNLVPGISVYSFYVQDESESSLPMLYRNNGYRTVALHSFDGDWWDRREKYPMLGFDEFYTRDDFDESATYVRRYISDLSTFNKITDIYESSEDPLFLFCVTMQNHGDFSARYDSMAYDIKINDLTYEDGTHFNYAENYISLIRESDDALRYLIEYFKQADEPTIIVFFGDHFPTLDSEFYSDLLQEDLGTITVEESIPIYETPYFIWANYDLSEGGTTINTTPDDYNITSLNFLGQTVLDLSGIKSPASRACLRVLQCNISAVSSLAVYDIDGIAHTNIDDINPEVRKILDDYATIQYGLLNYDSDEDE